MHSLQQLFVQVVEAGSFKQAAEQLHMEPSSLSRKIAALEKHLTVKLLHRSTRHTRPTELGQRYYEGLRKLLDDEIALEEEITRGVEILTGTLRVSAPVDFGAEFVVPVIHDMLKDAPELAVELLLSSHFVIGHSNKEGLMRKPSKPQDHPGKRAGGEHPDEAMSSKRWSTAFLP
jgi:DNA-binding transcriptional LysR family regulator